MNKLIIIPIVLLLSCFYSCYKRPNLKKADCGHSHICCQVGCECCREIEIFPLGIDPWSDGRSTNHLEVDDKFKVPYLWINAYYNPDDMSEYDRSSYVYIHGKVKQITEHEGTANSFGGVFELKSISDYDTLGNVSFQTLYRTNENINYYEVEKKDGLDIIKSWIITEKGDTVKSFESTDSTQYVFYEPFNNHLNKTYVKLDQYNRKVLDSIPGSGHTMAHNITYKYGKNTVIETMRYLSSNKPYSKTTYYVDGQGNWIEKLIEYNDDNQMTSILTKRWIQYYE
jgi:hypothetical protein